MVALQKSTVVYGGRHSGVNEIVMSWESQPEGVVLAQSDLAEHHRLLQDSSLSPWVLFCLPFLAFY